LCAEVITDLENLNTVPYGFMESIQVLDPYVDNLGIEFLYVVRFAGKGDHPIGKTALPDAVEQLIGRAHGSNNRLVRVVIEIL